MQAYLSEKNGAVVRRFEDMKQNCAIVAEGLGKRYNRGMGRTRHNTLRDLLADGAKRLIRRNGSLSPDKSTFWALKDATFDIERGENVGIIGLNGAGKSTLLKLLSRITEPSAGRARIAGRVGSLLEVGTGFHSELTGRENTYLYGAILGMNKAEINRKYDSIIDFAEIDEFIDTPVKRYSSGMYVRLAFAVAAHLDPEILLLDEVLSVGDLSFQRKCMDFATRLQENDATILFVSHNMFSIKAMCKRVIYLKEGRIQFDGSTDQGIALYEKDCQLSSVSWIDTKPDEWPIFFTEISLFGEDDGPKTVFAYGERMRLRLVYDTRARVEDPNFIIAFVRSDGVPCCNYSTEVDGHRFGTIAGRGWIELRIPPLKLVSELYTVEVLVREQGFQRLLCAQIGGTFHVRHHLLDTHFGVFHEPAQWMWKPGEQTTQSGISDAFDRDAAPGNSAVMVSAQKGESIEPN